MKKQVKIAQNLSFDKETISKLDENQLKEVAGGGSLSCNAGAAAVAEDDEATVDVHSCCNGSCNTK